MPTGRLLLLLTVCLPTLPLAAADPADFKPLFNTKDLAGWTPVNVAPNTFTNKGDVIYCTGVPTGVLRSDKMYENFVVELEWRHLTPGGNAGFFVWSDALTAKGQPFTRAIEVQVLDGPTPPDRRHTTHGDVFPIHGATLIPDNPFKTAKPGAPGRSYPTEDRSKPSPEWNHYRIECVDGKTSLAVNGKVVTTGHDASPRKGHLCLESEGGQVEWRNLKIKELPPTPNLDPKHVAAADEGFHSLYNGLDLSGWQTPVTAATRDLPPTWHARDWILRFEPPNSTPPAATALLTTLPHTTFDLLLDVRCAGRITLNVRGRPIEIDAPSNPKAWRRVRIAVRPTRITATVDDRPLDPTRPLGVSKESTFYLLSTPGTPADFANLYVKESK